MTELLTEQNENIIDSDTEHANSQGDFPDLWKGIKQPRSPSQWITSNEFFKQTFLNHPITARNSNNNITTMTTVVCSYFSENVRYADNIKSAEYERKYASFTTKDLKKKPLKKLKLTEKTEMFLRSSLSPKNYASFWINLTTPAKLVRTLMSVGKLMII